MVGKVLQFLNKNYERIKGKPVMAEVASVSKSTEALNYFVGNILINPDRVLSSAHAGTFNQKVGLNLYQEMIDKDPQIASCVRSRKKAVLNKAWEIIPASEKNRDVQIAEFVKDAFNYQRSRESRYELLDCIPKGLSVSEIMWVLKDDKILLADILGRNPNRFIFDKDFNLRLRTPSNPYLGEEVPLNKFIYLRNEPFAENPYGNAALKEIYWYYWFKKNAVKWWNIFMEKFGSPTVLAEHPPGQLNTAQKQALDTVLDTLQNATNIKVPEGIKISFLEALRRGDAGYLPFIGYCDEQITKSIHGQTLTSGQGAGGTGSYALGKVHEDTKYEYTADDCELLMDGINSQLIPPLVDFNFADISIYPKLVIHYQPPEDLKSEAAKDKIVFVEIGLPVTKDFLYEKYHVPKPAEDEELLEVPKKSAMPFSEKGKKKSLDFKAKGYQIVSTFKLRNKYALQIKLVIEGMEKEYLDIIRSNKPLRTALEEMIKRDYNPTMLDLVDEMNKDAIILGAQSMADQLNLTVNKSAFNKLMDNYFEKRVYELGKIEDMGDTLRELLEGKAQELFDLKLTPADISAQIKEKFPDLAQWKANQIAETEISRAADFAGTQMVKDSGLDVDAWFLGDPASCDICQEISSQNPYTLQQAESMGLAHPNCRCQWAFTLKGKET